MKLIFALSIIACTAAAWKNVLNIDCQTNFQMFGDNPALNMILKHPGLAGKFADSFKSEIAKQVTKACPSMPATDAAEIFDVTNLTMWLRVVDPTQKAFFSNKDKIKAWGCENVFDWPWVQTAERVWDTHIYNLPASCNFQTWATTGKCDVEIDYTVDAGSITLQASLTKCPNSILPSLSVACKGNGCTTFGSLCTQDTHCGTNQKCGKAMTDRDGVKVNALVILADDVKNLLQDAGLFADTSTPAHVITVFNAAVNKALSWLGYAPKPTALNVFSGTTADIGFCGIELTSSSFSDSFTKEHFDTATGRKVGLTIPSLKTSDGAVARALPAIPIVVTSAAVGNVGSYATLECDGSFKIQARSNVYIEGRFPIVGTSKTVLDTIMTSLSTVRSGFSADRMGQLFKIYKTTFWAPLMNKALQPAAVDAQTPAAKIFNAISKYPCKGPFIDASGNSTDDRYEAFYSLSYFGSKEEKCPVARSIAAGAKFCEVDHYFEDEVERTCNALSCGCDRFPDTRTGANPMEMLSTPSTCSYTSMNAGKCAFEVVADLMFRKALVPATASMYGSVAECSTEGGLMSLYFDCHANGSADACKLFIQDALMDGKQNAGCTSDADCATSHVCTDMSMQMTDFFLNNTDHHTVVKSDSSDDMTIPKFVRSALGFATTTTTTGLCMSFNSQTFDMEDFFEQIVKANNNMMTFNSNLMKEWKRTNTPGSSPTNAPASGAATVAPAVLVAFIGFFLL